MEIKRTAGGLIRHISDRQANYDAYEYSGDEEKSVKDGSVHATLRFA